MFRSATNVLGNALATSVVGKWEGDDENEVDSQNKIVIIIFLKVFKKINLFEII